MFNYVEPDFIPLSPNEIIPTAFEMNIKRLKTSHTPSSSNTKSSIGQQLSGLLKEEKST
jgi:hypothetical protein